MHRLKKLIAASGLSLIFFLTGSLSAIQIADFDTLANDRFANVESFVANSFDLSGIALNGAGRWATMISENVYVTAGHYAPGVGSSMTFYAGNDPDGTSVTRSITSNRQQIQGTDIFVGTLDSALPAGFSFFDFATEDINRTGVGSPRAALMARPMPEPTPMSLDAPPAAGRPARIWPSVGTCWKISS